MAQSFKSNHNSVYSCKYHVVFCPKYRRKVLTGEIAERLKVLVQELAVESESEVLEIEVMPDHVHLLVEVPPHYGIAKFVRTCKGRSSRILREEFPALKTRLPTLWTHSTFISTATGSPGMSTKEYILQQARSEPRLKKV
jgi:putative transposase